MRIAHIITRLIIGGAQENTLLNCEDLIHQFGDEVLLITGPSPGPEGNLFDRARAGGVSLEILDSLRRAIHPWRDFRSYREIKHVLHRFQPQVVHTHSAKGGFLGRMVAHALGIPAIVHTVHGAPFHPYQGSGARTLFRACERWAAHRCHAMISVADAMTDLMVEANVAPRDKFTTIYSGMEVEPFLESAKLRDEVRGQLGYRTDQIVVGKIARLFHLKGHKYVVEAAKQVVKANPLVQFLFVGDGILRDSLLQQIAAAGLEDHFQFTGLVRPERIPGLVAAMDIVVHASLREGLARVLPQTLIAGKPVVSYDIDGAREVVIPDETGYLLPPKSIREMADSLTLLAADRALRNRLGQEGSKRFAKRFAHEQMTLEIRALYERLLRSEGSAQ